MAGGDKPGEILRSTVGGLRCKEIDTVIAPPVLARKGRKRHDFDMSDAQGDEVRKLLRGTRIGPLGCESADVQLVDNGLGQRLLLECAAADCSQGVCVDQVRGAMDPVWLPGGAWIGNRR